MSESESSTQRKGKVVFTLVVCALIAAATTAVILLIQNTEPTAEKGGATRKSAALVSVIEVERGVFSPEIVALGRVGPARDIALSSRVDGEVIEVAPNFKPGGFIERKSTVLKLDPADYKINLALRRSELREAEAALAIEEGRRTVAEKEFALLNETIDETNRALVLREPQIASAEARVAAAQAAIQQAQLDLDRTELSVPFDAQILERSVNLGSQVSARQSLARLVGVEEYWVTTTVPVKSLQWIEFPEPGSEGIGARIRNRGAWKPGVYRDATVANLIGTVDEQTRLARVLLTVDDPLGLHSEEPPLILDSILEVRIQGRPFSDVVRLERALLRADDTVWVMQDGVLSVRKVDIVFRDATHVFISDGLDSGDKVVTTTLSMVADGIALRDVDSPTEEPVQK
ncbi:MAG: efflux RND transporter periplasmic adaptor subunit [Opitutaceae bacterium]